jgi:hypothetical protein
MVHIDVDDAPREHEVIEDVSLGATTGMRFVVPKVGLLLSAMIVEGNADERSSKIVSSKMRWLRAGFDAGTVLAAEDASDDDPIRDYWTEIIDRLDDPDDPLGLSHLLSLFEALQEAATGRPTTSSGGSSPTPQTKGSGAKRKTGASTSGNDDQDGSAT